MLIREASLNDVVSIAQIHVDTSRSTYKDIIPESHLAKLTYEKRQKAWSQILNEASNNGQFTYVAENSSGQIIGFANGGSERTSDPVYLGELNAIYISEEYQRKGIGRSLTLTIAERLAEENIFSMLVWVLSDNPACKFYEALGGKQIYSQQIERGGVKLGEVAYGWIDTNDLINF